MSTHACSICNSSTLINRSTLRSLAVLAGTLDLAFRQYRESHHEKTTDSEPWEHLGALLTLLDDSQRFMAKGSIQGLKLASNIERYWLGGFDSLCLSCGFLLMAGPETDPD
tara:strand:- start:12408 stop:12740 length:333 start_codon:yes stop_codon:yes gene_type:complete